jgi:branched-chain amino acid transport system ATP-binding protein
VGANGGGKSTLLKAISGLLKSEEGEVTDGSINYGDVRLDKMTPQDVVKLGIVQVVEGRQIFEHLTVDENLTIGSYTQPDSSHVRGAKEMVFTYFPRLKELRNHVSGYLSGGEQQMLVTGRAMMVNPKLMLLDEPSMGLAPMLVKEIFDIIKRFNKEQDTAILIVEQNVAAALVAADYVYVMENGKIVLDGPPSKLKDNEDLREFYLGLSRLGKKKSYREIKHYKRRKRWLV